MLAISVWQCQAANTRLTEVFNWKVLKYQMSASDEKSAIESGRYIPANNFPVGIERWNDKQFITVPRFKPGVLLTLNYISLSSNYSSFVLIFSFQI